MLGPISNKAQLLRGVGNRKSSLYKRLKKKKSTTDCAGKPLNHDRRMSSRQIFGHIWKGDTRKAQAPPTYTQLIQDVMRLWVKGKRAWFRGGERGKIYF